MKSKPIEVLFFYMPVVNKRLKLPIVCVLGKKAISNAPPPLLIFIFIFEGS